MSKVYDSIDERLTAFIEAQKMFFVATAPSGHGHVNMSPKGHDTFRILGPHEVAFLDLGGSGIETVAHRRQYPAALWQGPCGVFRRSGL